MPQVPEQDVKRMTDFHDQLEAASHQGPDRLAMAWASPPSGVGGHEIDRDTVIRKVNREELRILGYREDQMVGHRALDFIVLQDTAQRAIDDKFSGAREMKPFVRTFKKADGTPVTLALLDRHVNDAAGRVVGMRTLMVEVKLGF
jgi:PAS domain S-box-containing protein